MDNKIDNVNIINNYLDTITKTNNDDNNLKENEKEKDDNDVEKDKPELETYQNKLNLDEKNV